MDIRFLNGSFLPASDVSISPDDRGFLFADGVYEVMIWYNGFFYDAHSHLARLKRSLREVRIDWPDADSFLQTATSLITLNSLSGTLALVYFQVTRGAAPRKHSFPSADLPPTLYGFARVFVPDSYSYEKGVNVLLAKDIRWSRCDIKSIALLGNVLEYQKAKERGYYEVVFERDGKITEASHANIAFVINGTLFTHPESEYILPGVTRKNVLRIAAENRIPVIEEPVTAYLIDYINEAFLLNTSGEIIPVVSIDNKPVGAGDPGPVTRLLQNKFREEVSKKQTMK